MQNNFPAISGITDASSVRVALIQGTQIVSAPALGIGLQPLDADLTAIAALTPADRNIIVGNGTTWTTQNGQLPFPATQNSSADANTLDDYEEGTTTPTPTAASGTFTSVSATVSYTKIGNRVCWEGTVTITTNGTAAGHVILPLPFTSGVNASLYGRESVVTGAALTGNVGAGSAQAAIVSYNNFYPGANGHVLVVGGTYRV